jgi:hypothetical protein
MPDFKGVATKAGLECSDGRTIQPDAFKHQDGKKVPLLWAHGHNDPDNILGHAILRQVGGDTLCEAFFNKSPKAQSAKYAVEHGDVNSLSIWANKLVEKAKQVFHGNIKEVSLVLSGANPGALIQNVNIAHGDDIETLDDEVLVYTGLALAHADGSPFEVAPDPDEPEPTEVSPEDDPEDENEEDGEAEHADGDTYLDVYNRLDDEEKALVHHMVAAALEKKQADNTAEHNDNNEDQSLNHQEGTEDMTGHNVFEGDKDKKDAAEERSFTHDDMQAIIKAAKEGETSLKDAYLAHVDEYGITNIELLFPNATVVNGQAPEFIGRKVEWVETFMAGVSRSPFSRIKSRSADITHDEARAKGYVKATMKKEEWFSLAQRETTPQTIYKKQKLDRDDILDVTDFNVVDWMKGEMQLMLKEEVARAGLIGDGREIDDEDKILETKIRPIAFDDDFYTVKVPVAANISPDGMIEAILRSRKNYRGSGNPTMFTTEDILTDMLLLKDKMGRRLYRSVQELATELRVGNIVTVEVMEGTQTDTGELQAVLVNLSDYTFGADRGGQVTMFEDFDIDFNQHKYLIETRLCGALTKFHTAVAVIRANGTLATPTVPTFVPATGVVTIPTVTGVTYKNQETDATLSAGPQTAIAAGATISVVAVPNSTYYFAHNTDADWDFTRDA